MILPLELNLCYRFNFICRKIIHRYIFDLYLSPEVHVFLENFPHSTEESGDLCRILPHGNNGRILFRRTDDIRSPHTCLCRHSGKGELWFQPFRNLVARSGVVSTTPGRFASDKYLVPIVQQARWSLWPNWAGKERPVRSGIPFPDRPTRRESLYQRTSNANPAGKAMLIYQSKLPLH